MNDQTIEKDSAELLEYSLDHNNVMEIRSKRTGANQKMSTGKITAFVFDDETAKQLMDIKPELIRKSATITRTSTFKSIRNWASQLLEDFAVKMILA